MNDKELRTLDLDYHEARAKVRDGRTLVGYAAVFNRPVEIESFRGSFTETVLPGAFRKTLSERREQIQVLFNHGADPAFGQIPLGRPEVIREDDHGLYVEVPLFESQRNDEIIAAANSGALRGMSIQFMPKKDKWNRDRTERTIHEAALYEFGPVTFPAQPAAVMETRCATCRAETLEHESRAPTPDESRASTLNDDRLTRWMEERELEMQSFDARILSNERRV